MRTLFDIINRSMRSILSLVALLAGFVGHTQTQVTLEEAVAQALRNSKNIQAASLNIDYQQQVKRSATDIGKTSVMYMRGQYNSYVKNDNNITITQSIPFPTVFTSQNALGKSLVRGGELQKAATENELAFQVKQAFYELQYRKAREVLLAQQDSIFGNLVKAAEVRYRTGETRLLEKTSIETQHSEAANALAQARGDIAIYQRLLSTLMNSPTLVDIVSQDLDERSLSIALDTASARQNPRLAYLRQQVVIADAERKVAGAKFLPDINLGYFNQTLIGTARNESGSLASSSDRFQGFQVGVSLPLWFGPQAAKVRASAINRERAQATFEYDQTIMQGQWQQAVQEYIKDKSSVDHYKGSALKNAELLLKQSELAFRSGEIDYTELWLTTRNAIQIRENYLNSLNNLNQSVITLEFLAGVN